MKKGFQLGLVILILLNASLLSYAYYTEEAKCYFEEDFVCYDLELNQYLIEPEAQIMVQVAHESLIDTYQILWQQWHPEASHQVIFTVDTQADLTLMDIQQAAYEFNTLYPIDFRLNKHLPEYVATELNYQNLFFVPMHGHGFAFLTNVSVLEALGYPYRDENQNFLHDDFETFEAIYAAQAEFDASLFKWVISLEEPYAFYPFLTSHGFTLFPDAQGYYPGFEAPEFLEALKNIQEFSTHAWLPQEDQSASEYRWTYEYAFSRDNFVFSQVAEFMSIDVYDDMHEGTWIISRFPSIEGQAALQPFLNEVVGYTMKKDTAFPSLAHEVLRMILSVEGLQAYLEANQKPILRTQVMLDQLTFSQPFNQQFSYAHINARSEPLIALNNSPTTKAFRLYFDIEFMPIIQALWDQELTPESAQIEIAYASDAWLNEYAYWLKEEQLND